MTQLTPIATYTAPDIPQSLQLTVGDGPHTTNGRTTQISDVVIKSGGEDRDQPTKANDTPLGNLRAKLTSLQDNINIFLTERMQQEKEKDQSKQAKQADVEKRILDDGVDEEEKEE